MYRTPVRTAMPLAFVKRTCLAALATVMLLVPLLASAAPAQAKNLGGLNFGRYCHAMYSQPMAGIYSREGVFENHVRGMRCVVHEYVGSPFGWMLTAIHHIDVNHACRRQTGARTRKRGTRTCTSRTLVLLQLIARSDERLPGR